MKARWYQLPHSDGERTHQAVAFFCALFPALNPAAKLCLANLALDYWDNPGRYR